MKWMKWKICNEELNNRINQGEERICEHEDRSFDIILLELKKEINMKKSKESLCELWDIVTWNNIHVMGVLYRVEKRSENKEIMADNFQNLGRDSHPDT